jgi:hypothetical protein
MLSESMDDEPVKENAANFDIAMPRFASSAAMTAREPPVVPQQYPLSDLASFYFRQSLMRLQHTGDMKVFTRLHRF